MSSLALSAGPLPTPDHRDRIIKSLEEDNRDLQQQVDAARRELEVQGSESRRAVAELCRQLNPLYQALRAVFGEIDAIAPNGYTGESSSPSMSDKKRAIWESWKQKLPGKRAEFIQALLDHGEMTSAQLKVATHSGNSTVPQIIHQLNSLGLLQKNGNKYSLKNL